jgi:hypothetical protein
MSSTTLLPPGHAAHVDALGNLIIRLPSPATGDWRRQPATPAEDGTRLPIALPQGLTA